MRAFIFIITLFFSNILFGQTSFDVGKLMLNNCTSQSFTSDTVTISGKNVKATRIDITAKTLVQISCGYITATYDTVQNDFSIYCVLDSTGQLYDSVISEIKNYWMQSKTDDPFNLWNDFSHLWINKGFYIRDKNETVPFIITQHERDGAFLITCFERYIYKIILRKGTGFGCLSSFLHQNILIRDKNIQIDSKTTISNLNEMKLLLK